MAKDKNDTPTTPEAGAATTNRDANEQLEASRGVEFDDTRYSNHKYLVTDDDRDYDEGSLVNVGSGAKVYGPYRLAKLIAAGNGKQRWLAFKEGTSTMRSKPKTKDELIQEAAEKDAKLEAARKALRDQGIEPTF